jgi:carboxyl-terminal processing protease
MMHLSHSRRGVKALGALSAGFAFMLLASAALAEPRVALVIGNSAYQGDLPALPNPANDAKLMAQTLKSVGFDVVEAEDANQDEMKQAIAAFSEKLTAAGSEGTGLFFYAGHGVQVAGENYLIPVDAKIKREAEVDLVAVSASTVLKQMEFANSAVNIIILDACRNNPLGDGARSLSRGLAKIETAPRGSFIAYSTAPGSTAADGDGLNSPYTKALAETITEPGLSIADVFQEVRTKVLASTGNQQTPWDSSSLTGRFYFKPPEAVQTASVAAPSAAEAALKTEKAYWDSVKDSGDPDAIQLYLNKYPKGYFVDLANAKLDELKGGTQTAGTQAAPEARQSIQPSPAAAPSAAPATQIAVIAMQPQTIYAKTSGAQVRAAPSRSAEVLSKLRTNEEVVATGETKDGKWWRVQAGDSEGYLAKSVASVQPVATGTTAQSAQPQAPVQTAELQTDEADASRGLEMLDGGDGSGAQAQGNNMADAQAVGQLASAAQNGNLGQAANVLGSLFGNNQSGGQQAAAPQIVFQPTNATVTIRRGALIRATPVYNAGAMARATQDTKVQARGRTVNNLWWEVVLPNGQTGYVEGRMIGQ